MKTMSSDLCRHSNARAKFTRKPSSAGSSPNAAEPAVPVLQTNAAPNPRREKIADLRHKFLAETKPPIIQVVPPTPTVQPASSTLLAPPTPSPGGSSRNSTNSTTYSSSGSSSSTDSSDSSDSSSDSSSEDSSSEEETRPTAPVTNPSAPAVTKPSASTAKPSTPAAKPFSLAAVKPSAPSTRGFVSGVVPKPVTAQFPPRPNRPPPPPPASLGSHNLAQLPPPPLSPNQQTKKSPMVLLETDLDAFIDPNVDDIMNDPLLAPVGRLEVRKESVTSETTTKIVTSDPSLPGGSFVTQETVKSVHAPKPVVKYFPPASVPNNNSARDSPAQDPAMDELKVQPPAPLRAPEQEPEASIYTVRACGTRSTAAAGAGGQSGTGGLRGAQDSPGDPEARRSAQRGTAHLRRPPPKQEEDEEEEQTHLLTAPTWERERHSSSDSDKSGSETEFPPDLHAEDPTYMDFSLTTADFGGSEGHATVPLDPPSSQSSSDSDGDEEVYDPYFQQPTSSSLPNLLDDADGEFPREDEQGDEWDSSHGLADSQVIQICSVDALAKFSAKHTDRTKRAQPASNRVVLSKGPARSRQVPSVPAINLMAVRRSPRLLRKGMTGSLPMIFERPESFGEKDRRRPDFLSSTLLRASPENLTSPEDVSASKTAPAAPPSRNASNVADIAPGQPWTLWMPFPS